MKWFNDWLVGISLTIGIGLTFAFTQPPSALMSGKLHMLALAMILWLSAFLLLPRVSTVHQVVMTGVTPALLFLAGALLLSPTPIEAAVSAAMILALLTTLSQALEIVLAPFVPSHLLRRSAIILTAAALSSAPLWLGPLIELSQPGDFVSQAVISLSPLTQLSIALDFDYLRQDWMYRHSPLGSLPFSYPGLIQVITIQLVLVIGLLGVIWRNRREPPEQAGSGKP